MPANAAINWVEIIGCNINKCEVKRGESVRLQSEFVSGIFVMFHLYHQFIFNNEIFFYFLFC